MINQKYLIDFENLQVGDEVFHPREGIVTIISLNRDATRLPIITSRGGYYTREGKVTDRDQYPTLFKSNPFEEISEFPKIMRVRNAGQPVDRVIIGKYGNFFIGIEGVRTLETYNPALRRGLYLWEHAEDIPEVPEIPKTVLNKSDIARLAGCNIEDLEIID